MVSSTGSVPSSPRGSAFYLCMHGWKHLVGGVPFQQMTFWQDSNSYPKIFPPHLADVTWDTIKRHWVTQSYVLCMQQSYPSLFGMALHSTDGHLLYRWCWKKTKGCAQIDKLRVIQLVEADLNMALQIIFGYCLIHQAEDWGTIPLSQWGSRPNQSSTDAILLKRLSYDGLALLRQSAIISSRELHQ